MQTIVMINEGYSHQYFRCSCICQIKKNRTWPVVKAGKSLNGECERESLCIYKVNLDFLLSHCLWIFPFEAFKTGKDFFSVLSVAFFYLPCLLILDLSLSTCSDWLEDIFNFVIYSYIMVCLFFSVIPWYKWWNT